MTEFNPNRIQMFMFKWSAERYAKKAADKGFGAKIVKESGNWILLGGRWSVKIY